MEKTIPLGIVLAIAILTTVIGVSAKDTKNSGDSSDSQSKKASHQAAQPQQAPAATRPAPLVQHSPSSQNSTRSSASATSTMPSTGTRYFHPSSQNSQNSKQTSDTTHADRVPGTSPRVNEGVDRPTSKYQHPASTNSAHTNEGVDRPTSKHQDLEPKSQYTPPIYKYTNTSSANQDAPTNPASQYVAPIYKNTPSASQYTPANPASQYVAPTYKYTTPPYRSAPSSVPGPIAVPADGSTASPLPARSTTVQRSVTRDAGTVAAASNSSPTNGSTYTVKAGDTLANLAYSHGMTANQLWQLNPQISDPKLIHPGDVLKFATSAQSSTNNSVQPTVIQPQLQTLPQQPSGPVLLNQSIGGALSNPNATTASYTQPQFQTPQVQLANNRPVATSSLQMSSLQSQLQTAQSQLSATQTSAQTSISNSPPLSSLQSQLQSAQTQLNAAKAATTIPTASPSAAVLTRTVKSGDTFANIAYANGMTSNQLWAINPEIKDPNLIYPGEVIKLNQPSSTTQSSSNNSAQIAALQTQLQSVQAKVTAAQNAGYGLNDQIQYDSYGNIMPKSSTNNSAQIAALQTQLQSVQAKMTEAQNAGYGPNDSIQYDPQGNIIPKSALTTNQGSYAALPGNNYSSPPATSQPASTYPAAQTYPTYQQTGNVAHPSTPIQSSVAARQSGPQVINGYPTTQLNPVFPSALIAAKNQAAGGGGGGAFGANDAPKSDGGIIQSLQNPAVNRVAQIAVNSAADNVTQEAIQNYVFKNSIVDYLGNRGDMSAGQHSAEALSAVNNAMPVYDVLKAGYDELGSRGYSLKNVWDGWAHFGENVKFGITNPDQGLRSLKEGVDSTTAVTINVGTGILTDGWFETDFTGQEMDGFTSWLAGKR